MKSNISYTLNRLIYTTPSKTLLLLSHLGLDDTSLPTDIQHRPQYKCFMAVFLSLDRQKSLRKLVPPPLDCLVSVMVNGDKLGVTNVYCAFHSREPGHINLKLSRGFFPSETILHKSWMQLVHVYDCICIADIICGAGQLLSQIFKLPELYILSRRQTNSSEPFLGILYAYCFH